MPIRMRCGTRISLGIQGRCHKIVVLENVKGEITLETSE
jgi:hypothetical protein